MLPYIPEEDRYSKLIWQWGKFFKDFFFYYCKYVSVSMCYSFICSEIWTYLKKNKQTKTKHSGEDSSTFQLWTQNFFPQLLGKSLYWTISWLSLRLMTFKAQRKAANQLLLQRVKINQQQWEKQILATGQSAALWKLINKPHTCHIIIPAS